MSGFNFQNSEALLNRALKVIPNGTQTFSKSRYQYPVGNSPLYIVKGKGSHVWDADGNEYIDFVSGLCPIILGYCDDEVDSAVMDQIRDGVIYSLPHPIEIEVAETLCEMIPCAEMVRFGKNGSDATAGAVRVARAYTGRDHVLVCKGHYHGWQDWCNGVTGRNAGVPSSVKALTHVFEYNNIDSLRHLFLELSGNVACVIMEPMTTEWPYHGFLEEVKELCHRNGALFILDEVITGFRFALGGAQEYFHVIPDLACFGKAIANGNPLSALVGKAEIMQVLESKVHFSFTNGGECLSLAAAKATLKKVKDLNVPEILFQKGLKIRNAVHDMGYSSLVGHPARTVWTEIETRTLQQELLGCGILMIGTHNLNLSHSDYDIAKLLASYYVILPSLKYIKLNEQFQAGVRG